MDQKKSKPYFIELYDAKDNSLLNKYKLVLEANLVKELKSQIKEKLIAKNQVDIDSEIVIKDNDDYQLGSDDDVNDVIPDGKLKIYKKDKVIINVSVPVALSASTIVNVPNNSSSQHNIPVVVPAVDLNKLVTKGTILNVQKLTFPVESEKSKHVLTAFCPQIRKGAIKIAVDDEFSSHYTLSNYIVSQLGLSSNLKAILYNKFGQPYLFNLDLFHQPLPKLDFSQQHYIIFTATSSAIDVPIIKPIIVEKNLVELAITKGDQKYKIEIDLSNTLEVLKWKIFEVSRIHPGNQILKFAKNNLANNLQVLKTYGLVPNAILELSFKQNSNLVPSSFSDKFYYKDVSHVQPQEEESIVSLRSNLLALTAHLSEVDKFKFTTFLRAYTNNLPLVFAFKLLFQSNFISQTHRIALEEGLLVALTDFIKVCTPALDTLEFKSIFNHFRSFLGFVFEGFEKMTNLQQIKKSEETVELQKGCHFTLKTIKVPRLVKLDNGETVIVDRQLMEEQILKGFTYDLLKAPKKQNLYSTNELFSNFQILHSNLIDNDSINSLYWIGFNDKNPVVQFPQIGDVDKFINKIDVYPNLKIHQPMEIKNKCIAYLILKTKQSKLKVYVSKNKDIARPYNLFNVFTGDEEAVNIDLISANVKSQNVEEVIDVKIKAVITREPKQAIVVLFDISGSMGGGFFNEKDLKRIGAVKSFFEAFAYRTIAYNLEHVVSLMFFDDRVENQCGFTEAIYDFNRLISSAAPRGSTLMYDAIMTAIEELQAFKVKYPECLLRIVALTDGEDSGSKTSIQEAAKALIANKITIDSFAVGANCEGLKIVSKASGGKCYLTRNLEESLKLFEQETVLSVRARKEEEIDTSAPLEKRIQIAKLKPFDLPNNVHQFKMPEVKPSVSARDMVKRMEGSEEQKKIAGNNSLKRIAKEIQNYTENPHPFVSIYPCANINIWKILVLGPKETPYENGLFLLYAQFPGDYPFKAPQIRFITPIYHCNMNSQGRICHSVFDRNYSPALSFRQIIDCVYGLILTPEPEDPLDNVVATFYLSDYQVYYKNAQQATKDKASLTSQKIVDQIFGKITDDIEKKQREHQIDEWILMAKSFN